jgi:hypothetical protein
MAAGTPTVRTALVGFSQLETLVSPLHSLKTIEDAVESFILSFVQPIRASPQSMRARSSTKLQCSNFVTRQNFVN